MTVRGRKIDDLVPKLCPGTQALCVAEPRVYDMPRRGLGMRKEDIYWQGSAYAGTIQVTENRSEFKEVSSILFKAELRDPGVC